MLTVFLSAVDITSGKSSTFNESDSYVWSSTPAASPLLVKKEISPGSSLFVITSPTAVSVSAFASSMVSCASLLWAKVSDAAANIINIDVISVFTLIT